MGESQDPAAAPRTPSRPPGAPPAPRHPPPLPNVLVPRAVVALWGQKTLVRALSPAAPGAGHTCLLNQHLPVSPNDSRELIIPQPQEALGDTGAVTAPGPCPSSVATVSLPKVTRSIPSCSRPMSLSPPSQCLQGGGLVAPLEDLVALLEDSVAVAWPSPVAAVAAVTPHPAGAPSPPFPADPLTELLRKMNFPARIP